MTWRTRVISPIKKAASEEAAERIHHVGFRGNGSTRPALLGMGKTCPTAIFFLNLAVKRFAT